MAKNTGNAVWTTAAVLAGRAIFAGVFILAVSFKLRGIDGTAAYIAAAGLPSAKLLAWLAAIFELAVVACFLTGACFSEAALAAGVYVIFLAFAFHGPSLWAGNQAQFGFFVDHFVFLAGLLFAAANGPGSALSLKWGLLKR